MKTTQNLFDRNREWAAAQSPEFFAGSAAGQSPRFLWIGCSDSRIPAEKILNLEPGEMFVHRNVANQYQLQDASAQSVIEYGVGPLGIDQIIVCGHYGCGGVAAAMGDPIGGWVGQWVEPIREFYLANREEVDAAANPAERLSELNALEQARKLEESDAVKHARAAGRTVEVHAWVYSLAEGLFKSL